MNAARKRCSVVRRQAQQLRKRRTGGNTADYSARRALLQKIAGQPSSYLLTYLLTSADVSVPRLAGFSLIT